MKGLQDDTFGALPHQALTASMSRMDRDPRPSAGEDTSPRPVRLDPALIAAVPELAAAATPVYIARGQSEREAIYRFRYDVYIRELGYTLESADHELGQIHDADDALPHSSLLYTTDGQGAITGTARLIIWGPHEMPVAARELYSVGLFDGLLDRATAELSRLMFSPEARGAGGLLSIALACYQLSADRRLAAMFQYCAPGLAPYYAALGLKPYRGRLVEIEDGAYLPLVMFPFDLAAMRSTRSILAPLAALIELPGFDASSFDHAFEAESLPVSFAAESVLERLRAMLALNPSAPIAHLGIDALRTLCEDAFVMDLPAGMLLSASGVKQREVFVILDGTIVRDGPGGTSLRGCGMFLGEEGLLRGDGIRQASLRAVSAASVLVLRPGAPRRLARKDPGAAALFESIVAASDAARLAPPERALSPA